MSIKSIVLGASLICAAVEADAATYNARYNVDSFEWFCGFGPCDHISAHDRTTYHGLRSGGSGYAYVEVIESEDGSTAKWSLRHGVDHRYTLWGATLHRQDDGTYLYNIAHDPYYIPGSDFVVTWNGHGGTWYVFTENLVSDFRISLSYELANVPVPAAIALLPVGLGAFGVLRSRKRKRMSA